MYLVCMFYYPFKFIILNTEPSFKYKSVTKKKERVKI